MTSRLSKLSMAVGGTGIAAVIAAFVVVKNVDDLTNPFPKSVSELTSEDAALHNVDDSLLAKKDGNRAEPAKEEMDADDGLAGLTLGSEAVAPEAESDFAPAPPPPPPAAAAATPVSPAPMEQAQVAPQSSRAQPRRERTAELRGDKAKALQPLADADFAVGGMAAQAPADAQPGYYQDQGRDRFEDFEPNPVTSVKAEPVSTFSVDVDTAAYAFLRASLNNGVIPPANAIRVEELINYFPYDYEAPTDAQEPFKSNVTVTPTPWNADTKLMHIGIKGYTPPAAERPRSNIVLLIDTSGSMNAPNKLPLLINSFKLLLDTLDQDDTVSIVTYAGSAGTVLEPTPASERGKIVAAFGRLSAGGSTAGAAGLKLAYDKAQESFDPEGINRVILATDGDFNVGFSSPEEMETFVEKKRESGVFLSVLGFGQGNYNDHLMQTLAQNGNGVAAYIDTLSEARKVLADEAGGALIPIAKDVKIQVEFNPGQISEYRLIGYETRALNREDFNNDKVDAGEIGSGHTVTAIYEITPKGSPAEVIDPLRYDDVEAETVSQEMSDEYAFVKIRYKLPDQDSSTLLTRPVDASDEVGSLDTASNETRFAASVAAFGQLLRGETQISDYGYDDVIALASGAKGSDAFGYRAEFVNLVRLAKSLDSQR